MNRRLDEIKQKLDEARINFEVKVVLNVLLKPKLIHKLTIPATRSRQVVQFVSSTWQQRPRLLSATEVIFSVGVARRRWRWRTVTFVELVDSQWTAELSTWKVTWNISSTDQEIYTRYNKHTVTQWYIEILFKIVVIAFYCFK